MIDHVNNLKLQYVVELSKLGERLVLNPASSYGGRHERRFPVEDDEPEEVAHGL